MMQSRNSLKRRERQQFSAAARGASGAAASGTAASGAAATGRSEVGTSSELRARFEVLKVKPKLRASPRSLQAATKRKARNTNFRPKKAACDADSTISLPISARGSEVSAASGADSPASPKRLRRRSSDVSEGAAGSSIKVSLSPSDDGRRSSHVSEGAAGSIINVPLSPTDDDDSGSGDGDPVPEAISVPSEEPSSAEAPPIRYYVPDMNAYWEDEYVSAMNRTGLKGLRDGGMQFATELLGHDTADLFLSWSQGNERKPAQAAAHAILQFHKAKMNIVTRL